MYAEIFVISIIILILGIVIHKKRPKDIVDEVESHPIMKAHLDKNDKGTS